MPNITIPSVHLNGSSGERLLAEQMTVCRALRTAIEATNAAAPNQRDFYPQGEVAWSQAQREHRHRLETLRASLAEHEAIADGIQEQLDAREAQRSRR